MTDTASPAPATSPTASPPHDVNTAGFWDTTVQEGRSGWNLGTPAPLFVDWMHGPDRPPPGRVAVPGCGHGHDALRFAAAGHRVTGFDFAEYAIRTARANAARLGLSAEFVQTDIFALGPERDAQFDVVAEYTCFCAIDPSRRAEYARLIARLLRPGGLLAAIFYPLIEKEGGPPFSVSEAGIRGLLDADFELLRWENRPRLSVPARAAHEAFTVWRRR